MNKYSLSTLLRSIASGFSSLFGTLKWNGPAWLKNMRDKSHNSPKTFWSATTLIALLLIGSAYAIYWYKTLPKPTYVTASITAPPSPPNEEVIVPATLLIDFGIKTNEFTPQSVAPINKIGKKISEGITITPEIPGQWTWNSDSQLAFTPEEDWPAGQEYTIHCAKNFFTPDVLFESHDFYFSTQAFKAIVTEFKFYQDPINSEVRNAVATIVFNFPVNPESLEQNTSLVYESLNKSKWGSGSESVPFTYTYDAHKRIAYLHSDPIKITDKARYLRLTLGKEVASSTGSANIHTDLSQNMLIPDSSNFLKVLSASASIVRNDKDRPEQVLSVETSLGVNERDFNQSVHLYLLPQNYPATAIEPEKPNYQWQNPGEITDAILALATPLTKDAIPSEHNYSSSHSFKFATQTPRYIYLKVDKGMKGLGNFKLSTDYTAVIPVPELPKEISFLHKGSLLALSGEKKLSVLVRGVPAVQFNFARVEPTDINQLVTQTHGDFNNPYFNNPTFNQQNISQIFTHIQEFDTKDLAKEQYTALDLGKYIQEQANTLGPQGLFLIQATGWDVQNKTPLDVKASRLILITDLGMLVKDNIDGTHDVFVQSITQGIPVPNATISILGKNGLPLLSKTTDAEGRANFPTLKDFIDDREPAVYLAQLNNDVSFIPYSNPSRLLNYSKFDIGGMYTNNQELQSLSAYLFSDRGIYRPGDEVHIGMIVKQAYAQPQPPGLPLQATITDPRGTTIKDQKMVLNDSGYMDLDFATTPNSPTGQYQVNLYLVKDNHPQNLLGSATVRVSEFQPDRMRIKSRLEPAPADGWSAPTGLKAEVDLWNLYGAPAAHRRISGRILLTPEEIEFTDFPDYVFSDPLNDPKKPKKVFTETITDVKTNDKGHAEFDLHLDKFDKATYQLTFFAEGFEAEGGRSVTTQSKALISPLAYFVGYKADGDLSFMKQNSQRSLNYIAINPQLDKQDVADLKLQLVSLHPQTTLVKKADGTYQYQSIMQSTVISTEPFTISAKGTNYSIPTNQIGTYSLTVLSKDDTVLSQLKFTVVGASQAPLAKNAELSIKLNKTTYQANEPIEIQITAPYTGSGLITIERDKVYASKWFKADTTNSLQSIQVPADFQGNGYVNVAFIRDWESPELFISPLSYSIAAFEVEHDAHKIKIDLNTPQVARPGEPFAINYTSDKPGKIIVFAVDEGILQVAHYETPDPLAFFFQKHALEVLTQQTVDQILPKFIQDRELSAAGGDGGDEDRVGTLNPFKRKTDAPVVFWSGIMDTDNTTRQVTYQIPDYFNGTLKVMAVAVSNDALGASETSAEVRGDFVINPNVPTFAAPGDEFEVSVSIANNIKDSGDHAPVTIELSTSPGVAVNGPNKQVIEIAEGQEQTARFLLKAQSVLGSARLNFKASSGDKNSAMNSTLSVRPANPFSTTITSGMTSDASQSLNIIQSFFPESRNVDATLSTSPLILVFGLQRYLENFPYGCTEQLTSKSMPLLAMNAQNWFNKDSAQISKKVQGTIQMLSQRQMSNGSFSYWPNFSDNQSNSFVTVYAMQFLTEARAQGFIVPDDVFFKGISYLKDLASQNASSLDNARIQAYAIYILTRNELVTTNYLTNLQLYLQQDASKAWQKDITAVYIAASYQMLKSFDEANQLISQYRPDENPSFSTDFYDKNAANAQYLYILAKHFPERLKQIGDKLVLQLVQSINNDQINTILSGYASLALGAYQPNASIPNTSTLSLTQTLDIGKQEPLSAADANYQKHVLAPQVRQITLNNPDKLSYFYQLIQAGFDKNLPTESLKQGMELFREYRDATGAVVTSASLGSEIEVHIQIRALDNKYLSNIAIEDLLPAGFEVVADSVKTDVMDYFDVREDRVNFFGTVEPAAKELVYKIKATNIGTYTVPPAYAEAMYNPTTKARSIASKITVTKPE